MALGCTPPQEEAQIGDEIASFHIRDARTGNCIHVSGTGKYNHAWLADPKECVR